ncbi:9064_t:CDS:1 [Dentiscutata erythropus]|uniref:9064_t:CDS:1 n=1 Tax=Dentiscutata erythropus TaxID=1348616 RepID=A0A9N9EMX5_9GLOM|nr:9064_t:CDS:1 [Dentiscutata erythropus]
MLLTNHSKLFTFLALIFIFYLSLLSVTFGHDQHPDANKPCPLAEKCPYYKAVQSGEKLEDIDWTTTKCPAAEKCPYFEDVKKKAEANDGKLPSFEKGCPYAENCPHADKHHKHSKDGDESKCPYMSGDMKGCPYLSGEGKEDKDAAAKCPHFQKMKAEKEAAEAAAKNKDEL